MEKKSKTKSKLTQEEIQQRLNSIKAADQLEDMKRDMGSPARKAGSSSGGAVPIESLSSAGQDTEAIYCALVKEYLELLDTLATLAFAPELRPHYFKNNRIKSFLSILQKAGMPLQVRSMMDIFKDRVKQRNNGALPTVKEKVGLFGKVQNRPMKIEEIASKYDIEIDIPPGVERPLTACGTQIGLLMHLRGILFDDEDIRDLLKRNPRKLIARFLQAAGLINLKTANQNEKYLIASLITPESIQPKSPEDKDALVKYRSIVGKGKKWVDAKLEALQKSQETEKAQAAN